MKKEQKINIKELKVGDEFTTINDVVLCEKYVVPCRNNNPGGKAPKQPKRINRLVENQFYLHGSTDNLRKNIDKINPDAIIGIHYKKHGTSMVCGNILVKKKLNWYERLGKKLGLKVIDTEYDIVYSSRQVVKNQYLNEETGAGYYGEDIWGVVAKEIGHLIPKNWTIYGEIIGFTPSGSPIQGKYDYGCKPKEHKFYVYKVSIVNEDGHLTYLTDKQIEEWCLKVDLLYSDTLLYYGAAYALFSKLIGKSKNKDFNLQEWREKFIELLEKEYNEKDCKMCLNKVPEEGIVLRVEKTFEYEAYKLKSKKFILMESDLQEKEETNLEDNQDVES